MRLDLEWTAWMLVLVGAGAWRLPRLGSLPPDTHEALRLRQAWDAAHPATTDGLSRALSSEWPVDLTSILASAALRWGGDDLTWARLPAALLGVGAVATFILLRPTLGRGVALLAALLLAGSPTAIHASRTLNADSLPLIVAIGFVSLAGHRHRRAVAARGVVLALLLVLPLTGLGVASPASPMALLRGWAGLSATEGAEFPPFAPLLWVLAYEPLVLALGLAGIVRMAWQSWSQRRLPARLDLVLAVWFVTGTVLCCVLLHHRPGPILPMMVLPLVLSSARLIADTLSHLPDLDRRLTLPMLVGPAVALGFLSLRALDWARAGHVPHLDGVGALALLLAGFGWTVVALYQSPPRAAAAAVVAASGLLLGGYAAHSSAAIIAGSGYELLTGARAVPERAAAAARLRERALRAAPQPLFVEEPLARALAWDLRGLDIRPFSGSAPPGTAGVRSLVQQDPAGDRPRPSMLVVEQRWFPDTWHVPSIIRWLVYRRPWDSVTSTFAG